MNSVLEHSDSARGCATPRTHMGHYTSLHRHQADCGCQTRVPPIPQITEEHVMQLDVADGRLTHGRDPPWSVRYFPTKVAFRGRNPVAEITPSLMANNTSERILVTDHFRGAQRSFTSVCIILLSTQFDSCLSANEITRRIPIHSVSFQTTSAIRSDPGSDHNSSYRQKAGRSN